MISSSCRLILSLSNARPQLVGRYAFTFAGFTAMKGG
jgi:hypothetical protein